MWISVRHELRELAWLVVMVSGLSVFAVAIAVTIAWRSYDTLDHSP